MLPHLSEDELSELMRNGRLSATASGSAADAVSVSLAPAFERVIRSELETLRPTFGVEVLYLTEAPRELKVGAELMTVLQSISTMAGIEYYSHTRQRMRLLFQESYVIVGPDERTRRPDPIATSVVDVARLHIYQRDSSFGENVLELTYSASDEAIRMRMRNLTRMVYQRVIPAVGAESLEMNLVIYPLDDRLLFYGSSAARATVVPGLEQRVSESFANRMEALYRWLLSRLAA